MRAFVLALLAILSIGTARAEENGNYENGDAVSIAPDKAYFLIRVMEPADFDSGAVLARLLSDEELRNAIEKHRNGGDHDQEPNVLFVQGRYHFAGTDNVRILLASGKPGRYILAGAAEGGMSYTTRGVMYTCLCLGTVQFEAKAGVITDLGTLLLARDDRPSPIPELARQVHGRSFDVAPVPLVLGIRPYVASMAVPDTLASFPRQAAAYRAFGPFPNYFGAPIDRLAPVPGVLDYDKDGHVLDLGRASN